MDLTLFLISYSAQFIYAGLFLLLFLSGLGLPIPEEMTLLTAGFLVHLEILRLYPTVITIFIGVLAGDLALYSIGRKWGKGIFTHRYLRKVFSENRLENVRRFFRDHGSKTIFIARFISGFRVAAFLAAGSMEMKPGKVLLYDFFAALVYIPLLLALAYYFGEKIQLLTDVVSRVDFIVKVALVLAGLMGLGYYLLKKKVFDAK